MELRSELTGKVIVSLIEGHDAVGNRVVFIHFKDGTVCEISDVSDIHIRTPEDKSNGKEA